MPDLLFNSIVSGRDQKPYVQILLDGKVAQFTPEEARSFALQLLAAAEAAVSDAFLIHFMGGVGAGDPDHNGQLGGLLNAFRDYRANLRAKGDPLQWGEPSTWPEGKPPSGL